MFNFFEFYANGGVFMHAVSLTAVLAVTALFLDARARKLGDDDPKRLRVADRLLVLCVGIGLLGVATGVTELFGAMTLILPQSTPEEAMSAFARGGMIVPAPLIWALLVSLPIWIAGTIQRHRAPGAARRQPMSAGS